MMNHQPHQLALFCAGAATVDLEVLNLSGETVALGTLTFSGAAAGVVTLWLNSAQVPAWDPETFHRLVLRDFSGAVYYNWAGTMDTETDDAVRRDSANNLLAPDSTCTPLTSSMIGQVID